MHRSDLEPYRTLLGDLEVSSFVAGLLNSGDVAITGAALQLAQLLMAKLPDVFRVHFVKEGVVHVIDKLAASANAKVSHAWTRPQSECTTLHTGCLFLGDHHRAADLRFKRCQVDATPFSSRSSAPTVWVSRPGEGGG